MCYAQLPKLIAEDVPLFNALNSDFFPGLEIPPTDYGSNTGSKRAYMRAGMSGRQRHTRNRSNQIERDTRTHTHTHTHTYTHARVRAHTHSNTHTYTYTRTCTHTHIYTHASTLT